MLKICFTNRNCSGHYENNGVFFLLQGQMFLVSILQVLYHFHWTMTH